MLFNRLYYQLKPILPWALRIAVRRSLAKRKRLGHSRTWPINPAAGNTPENWPGWPAGKRFALVLTHDVESQEGLSRCRQLMELEMGLGFRSSFNFIPEGDYTNSKELRDLLTSNGFEVGVHDLKHDGKLFQSRRLFRERAFRVNQYLKDWGAVGFRSAFMMNEREWLHDLNIQYDASTFDTDPFEPQPQGADTIFPFWVEGPEGGGYVEMPYTLPQDSTLFVILKEKGIDVWKKKLDWIAESGGMALLDVHPDYLGFQEETTSKYCYSVRLYREFLEYVLATYKGRFWNPLPREMAHFIKERANPPNRLQNKVLFRKPANHAAKTIWIDLDNTPHVPFFEPILEELKRKGFKVLLTARDAFQVCDLADQKKLVYEAVGRHYGKNRILKVLGLFYRALQLLPMVIRQRPHIAVSHGSRSQLIACNLLGIPSVLLADYEHATHLPFMRPRWEMVPEVIPTAGLYCASERIRKYPGIKEDVYVNRLTPNIDLLGELGLNGEGILVTARPPATEAHYHNPESEELFVRFMERAFGTAGVRVVLLPRNKNQAAAIRKQAPHWFERKRVIIPSGPVDGLNLLWHSDLVVSGGGTMNREAAALGIPVYSIFRGPTGAVDRFLQKEGRLVLIQNAEEVVRRILLIRRKRKPFEDWVSSPALSSIVGHLEEILEIELGLSK